jgi:hypothetical protein
MIRKFNFTGRKKIKRSLVRVDLRRDGDGCRCFDIALSLDTMALPAAAHLYVEAYHRTAYQRFDCGTVANLRIPEDRRLLRFSETLRPLFRVKVVDRSFGVGRILAAVDKVRPQSVDDLPADSQSLLFVEYDDLGNAVWQLDLDGDWPVLRLNRNAEDISLVASSDKRFLPLVYPEVLRQILVRVLLVDEHSDPYCDDDWPSLWLKLASRQPGVGLPPDRGRSDQGAWIDKAVESFSGNYKMLAMFNQAVRESR